MIAYHFPPLAGSSGIQRTLRFVQHLPALGWEPLVLTTHPRAYERTSDDLMGDVPKGTVVRRAFALDAARHLQLGGRYLGWTARPDRWISWRFDGVREGLRLIDEYRPNLIWSTYPIATAHVIASELHRKSGLPWIADFRDPMAQDGYPVDPRIWRVFKRIETDAVSRARYCVFTTPGAARDYRGRFPEAADRMVVLENGYDEESFAAIPPPAVGPKKAGEPVVLLHSGIVYPSERDPTHFFQALGRLKQLGLLDPQYFRVRFRAAVHDAILRKLAVANGASDFIELCPPVPYRDALREMAQVDALLILQASNCNDQIPAKVYEYLRVGRPILGLTDPLGDTAGALRDAGLLDIIPLDSTESIMARLPALVRCWQDGGGNLPASAAVEQASRRGRSRDLAALLRLASGAS